MHHSLFPHSPQPLLINQCFLPSPDVVSDSFPSQCWRAREVPESLHHQPHTARLSLRNSSALSPAPSSATVLEVECGPKAWLSFHLDCFRRFLNPVNEFTPLLTSRICSSLFSLSSCRAVDRRPGGEVEGGRPEQRVPRATFLGVSSQIHPNHRAEFFWSLKNKDI